MCDWQPIETAPRDGTVIQMYDPTMGVVVGAYCDDDPMWPWVFCEAFDWKPDPGNDDITPFNAFRDDQPPSHWRPRAKPPDAA